MSGGYGSPSLGGGQSSWSYGGGYDEQWSNQQTSWRRQSGELTSFLPPRSLSLSLLSLISTCLSLVRTTPYCSRVYNGKEYCYPCMIYMIKTGSNRITVFL